MLFKFYSMFEKFACLLIIFISKVLCEPPLQTNVLWSLAPCQSAFWVHNLPSTPFNQNYLTYQYEGNPLSKFNECVFTLESDPNTRIELSIQEVSLFGKEITFPPPCLELYDVKSDGTIKRLKKECSIILAFNEFESFPSYTDSNIAIITTTIRYGSFKLRVRAVPRTFGFPKLTTTTESEPTNEVPATQKPSVPSPALDSGPTVITILPQSANLTAAESNFLEYPTRIFHDGFQYNID